MVGPGFNSMPPIIRITAKTVAFNKTTSKFNFKFELKAHFVPLILPIFPLQDTSVSFMFKRE